MGFINRSPVFDVGKNKPRKRIVMVDGVPAEERLPNGVVEKWVDSAGNVVAKVMAQPAQLRSRQESAAKNRDAMRRRGWIEHHECPKRSGTIFDSPGPSEPCATGTYGRGKACPHVEAVIAARQKANGEKEAQKLRNANFERERQRELDERKAVATEKSAEAMTKTMERVASLLEKADQPKGKRIE
jgi:hypothetical protein